MNDTNFYTLDGAPDWDDEGVIKVKVIPGTPEEQLASLEARLAMIDMWIDRMENSGDTHSYERHNELCRRREHVAEHAGWLLGVVTAMTPDPEPPTDEVQS